MSNSTIQQIPANEFFKTCCLVAAGAMFGYTIVKSRLKKKESEDQRNFHPSKLLKNEDPRAIMRYLRSKLKNYPPAYDRKFTRIVTSSSSSSSVPLIPASIGEKRDSDKEIRVMSWNILARALCQVDEYWKAPKEAGDWLNYRVWRTLEETIRFNCDIICLQEIDAFEDIKPYLHSLGYTSVFCPKYKSPCLVQAEHFGPDGCAIFWRKDKFQIVNMQCCRIQTDETDIDSQVFIVVQLEHRKMRRKLTVVCLHLKASDDYSQKREQQIRDVLKRVKQHLREGSDVELAKQSLIMCGDFNGGPDEKFYQHVVTDSELGGMVDSYTSTNDQANSKRPTLYVVRQAEKLERVIKTLDFVFYSKETLQLTENLELPPDDDPSIVEHGLPNLRHSSDHLSLVSSFRFIS